METAEEIKDIAKFMGYEMKQGKELAHYISGGNQWYWVGENFTVTVEEYQPDKRWDWLMPIVEKIEELTGNSKEVGNYLSRWTHYFKVFNGTINTDIKVAYALVIEFINWYNTQPKI